MRISVHTAQVFERAGSIDAGFAMLKRAGIEGIQFGLSYYLMPAKAVRNHLPSIMDAPIEEVLEVVRPYKEAAERHGISISQVHAPFPMFMHEDEPLMERMKTVMQKSILITEYMNSPHLIIHPATTRMDRDRYDASSEWELNKKLYAAMIPLLRKHHVMALLENLFSLDDKGLLYASVCADFGEAASWVDALNALAGEELFGFCFDTGHCVLARQNIYRAIKLLGSRLKALHMQDNSGYNDDHRAPFTGVIDWEKCLQALKEVNYQGDLNFEAGNAVVNFPAEMTEDCLHMLALTGQYFRRRLLEA